MHRILIVAALLMATGARATPPPPPDPETAASLNAFFSALPQSFPAGDLDEIKSMIDDDLKVFVEGRLVAEGPEGWLDWLACSKGGAQSISMSREEFFLGPEDSIVVREFWHPYSEGKYSHPPFPIKFVRYEFEDGRLVRVDYLAQAERLNGKLGAGAETSPVR